MAKVAYHGTPHGAKVLREGLLACYADGVGQDKSKPGTPPAPGGCPHIWLARKPEDAAAFGDVLEVNMEGIPGDFEPGEWQGCYHGGDLGPERLRRHVT